MKLEVEAGQFVRMSDGQIVKIPKKTSADDIEFAFMEQDILGNKIKKASHNLIDLIEVGDIISVRIHGDISKYEVEQFDLKGKIIGIRVQILEDIRIFELKELDIISILTKEQYSQNVYRVEE